MLIDGKTLVRMALKAELKRFVYRIFGVKNE
jgi:hypothetical protein